MPDDICRQQATSTSVKALLHKQRSGTNPEAGTDSTGVHLTLDLGCRVLFQAPFPFYAVTTLWPSIEQSVGTRDAQRALLVLFY